ncbi:excalibur calcium-binding domain-containing protein [Deinococcus sp. QL22]
MSVSIVGQTELLLHRTLARSQPGYRSGLDGDGDGRACE